MTNSFPLSQSHDFDSRFQVSSTPDPPPMVSHHIFHFYFSKIFRILVFLVILYTFIYPIVNHFFLYFFRSKHIPSGLENILIIKSGDLIKIKFFTHSVSLTFSRLRNQKNVSIRKKSFFRESRSRIRGTYRHRDGLHRA